MAHDTFTFNIVEHIMTIAKTANYKGEEWTKELNVVSWNGKAPKLDLREWNSDHSRMSKGVTITDSEAKLLSDALNKYMERRQ